MSALDQLFLEAHAEICDHVLCGAEDCDVYRGIVAGYKLAQACR